MTKLKMSCEFTFFGERWKCLRFKEQNLGGEISHMDHELKVQINYDVDSFKAVVHHELLEMGICINGCEYTRDYPDRHSVYVMIHKEMDNISTQVRVAYDEIVFKMTGGRRDAKPNKRSRPRSSRNDAKKGAKVSKEKPKRK